MAQRKIGSKMTMAAEFVRNNPGCTKLAAAEWVGPHNSRQYGYEIVNRAIRAGLIHARMSGSRYQLFPGDWDMDTVNF